MKNSRWTLKNNQPLAKFPMKVEPPAPDFPTIYWSPDEGGFGTCIFSPVRPSGSPSVRQSVTLGRHRNVTQKLSHKNERQDSCQSRCDVTEMSHKKDRWRNERRWKSNLWTFEKEKKKRSSIFIFLLFYCSIVLLLGTPGQIFQSYNLIGYPMSPSAFSGIAGKCLFFGFVWEEFGSNLYKTLI